MNGRPLSPVEPPKAAVPLTSNTNHSGAALMAGPHSGNSVPTVPAQLLGSGFGSSPVAPAVAQLSALTSFISPIVSDLWLCTFGERSGAFLCFEEARSTITITVHYKT